MSEQDRLDAYSEGFDDGYDGRRNLNPYYVIGSSFNELSVWKAYEKGYREGIAEKNWVRDKEQ